MASAPVCGIPFALALLILMPIAAGAADYPAAQTGDWICRDFRFHTGEVLPELRMHYTTVGAPGNEPVILLHGTGQSGANFLSAPFGGVLFAPGAPLDAKRHYVIMPDGIGHGKSSKPSDGLRARFPRYNYEDMVAAQYRLLTEHLHVSHVRLILGTSMGGMQAWIWGGKYPDFMDALAPLASEPAAMAGRNWMLRRMVIDAIRSDPGWHGGDYTEQPTAWRTAAVFFNIAASGGALAIYRANPTRKQSDAELDRRLAAPPPADANDTLYSFDSARDYDPVPALGKIKAPVLAINSADDERNPPELGLIEATMKHLKASRYVLLPITPQSRGHGTTYNAALWQSHLADFLSTLQAASR